MQNNNEENLAQEISNQETSQHQEMEENNNNNASFITAYPQNGILDGGVTDPAAIGQKLAEHGFHWPTATVLANSTQAESRGLFRKLAANVFMGCPNVNQVKEQDGARKLCDVMGLIQLPTTLAPDRGHAALLVRIKHMTLLENSVMQPVNASTCFLNRHKIYLGRLGEKGMLEWFRLPSLRMLKLDLEKMSVIEAETNPQRGKHIIFTPLPDLLITKCGLPLEKHTAVDINKLIGNDPSPVSPPPVGCINVWCKAASPRKKDKQKKDKQRDESPKRDAASTDKPSKKAKLELKGRKKQAKENARQYKTTYEQAKKLKREARAKLAQAQSEVNKCRRLIVDHYDQLYATAAN